MAGIFQIVLRSRPSNLACGLHIRLQDPSMYKITTGIHIHFAHHIRGHAGPCVSIHGHTWRFDVTLVASELDAQGFVVDFDELHARVLMPCHRLLDHSLALGESSFRENRQALAQLGHALVETRRETLGNLGSPQAALEDSLGGARNEHPGGIKLAVFPFSPTSERLAQWLFEVADASLSDGRVSPFPRLAFTRRCFQPRPSPNTARANVRASRALGRGECPNPLQTLLQAGRLQQAPESPLRRRRLSHSVAG